MPCYRETALIALKQYIMDYSGNFWSKPALGASLDENIGYAEHSRRTLLANHAISFLSAPSHHTPEMVSALDKLVHAYDLIRTGSVTPTGRHYRHVAHAAILYSVLFADTVPSQHQAGRFRRFVFPVDLRLDASLWEGECALDFDDITYGNFLIDCIRANLDRLDRSLSRERDYTHIADVAEREKLLRRDLEKKLVNAWLGRNALNYICQPEVRAMELDNAIGRLFQAISILDYERSAPDALEDWRARYCAVAAGICFASVHASAWPTSLETYRFVRSAIPNIETGG